MPRSIARITFPLLLLTATGVMAADYRCRDGVSPPAVHNGSALRVASLNIAHGRGSSLNQMLIGRSRIEKNLDRAATAMRETGAQVVALQELDVDSRWAGSFDHAERLLQNSHLDCVILGLHAQTWLYRFGTGLLSTVAMAEPRAHAFAPTPPTTTKGLVAATLTWRRGQTLQPVRVSSVHLDFSRQGARQRQVDQVIASVRESPLPIIVMGDFNEQWDVNGSVINRLVDEAGLVAYRPQSSELRTYRSKRLDWILVSPQLEFVDYRVVDEALSDHRLVVAELRWKEE